MRLGGGFDFILDEYNKVALNVEFAKLLVPTPQEPELIDIDGNGTIDASEVVTARAINNENYKKLTGFQGC